MRHSVWHQNKKKGTVVQCQESGVWLHIGQMPNTCGGGAAIERALSCCRDWNKTHRNTHYSSTSTIDARGQHAISWSSVGKHVKIYVSTDQPTTWGRQKSSPGFITRCGLPFCCQRMFGFYFVRLFSLCFWEQAFYTISYNIMKEHRNGKHKPFCRLSKQWQHATFTLKLRRL